jgi:hypothetical protein
MRKPSMQVGLVGLMLVAAAGAAHAQDATSVTTTSTTPAPKRKLQVALSFLPMSLGTFNAVYGGMPLALDAAFAPGGSLAVTYEVVSGLSVGLAPQVLFNVKPKEDPLTTDPAASKEVDAMVRIAYAYPLVDTISVYAAALPGYSLIMPKVGDKPKGPVFAFELGAMMNLGERTFISLAGGYQWGFQQRTDTSRMMQMDGSEKVTMVTTNVRPNYYRAALGLGWRF